MVSYLRVFLVLGWVRSILISYDGMVPSLCLVEKMGDSLLYVWLESSTPLARLGGVALKPRAHVAVLAYGHSPSVS
jgi:hypothetical protein